MGLSTRSFGLPNEVFYALFFGIFIFIITTIKERNLIPEFLKGHARSIIAIGQKL